jgi:hypothetical protein
MVDLSVEEWAVHSAESMVAWTVNQSIEQTVVSRVSTSAERSADMKVGNWVETMVDHWVARKEKN